MFSLYYEIIRLINCKWTLCWTSSSRAICHKATKSRHPRVTSPAVRVQWHLQLAIHCNAVLTNLSMEIIHQPPLLFQHLSYPLAQLPIRCLNQLEAVCNTCGQQHQNRSFKDIAQIWCEYVWIELNKDAAYDFVLCPPWSSQAQRDWQLSLVSWPSIFGSSQLAGRGTRQTRFEWLHLYSQTKEKTTSMLQHMCTVHHIISYNAMICYIRGIWYVILYFALIFRLRVVLQTSHITAHYIPLWHNNTSSVHLQSWHVHPHTYVYKPPEPEESLLHQFTCKGLFFQRPVTCTQLR